MTAVTIELDESLAQVLSLLDQPLAQTVRELTVLELYRCCEFQPGDRT